MPIRHAPFKCEQCQAKLDLSTEIGKVEAIAELPEPIKVFTVCGYCGAIYSSDAMSDKVLQGLEINWRRTPEDGLPEDVIKAARFYRISWLWKKEHRALSHRISKNQLVLALRGL